jgi:prophage regulatory protein
MKVDILERLCIDPGSRTFGELAQDREAASIEIARLRRELEHVRGQSSFSRTTTASAPDRAASPRTASVDPPRYPGSLLRIKDVSAMLGMSRSTIYRAISEGIFPKPVNVGERSVRWRLDAVEAWRDSLHQSPKASSLTAGRLDRPSR